MNISDKAIEAAARAIYESRNGAGCKPWSRVTKAHKDPYLSDARAAIDASDRQREADGWVLVMPPISRTSRRSHDARYCIVEGEPPAGLEWFDVDVTPLLPPIIPTLEMLKAGDADCQRIGVSVLPWDLEMIYRATLAARPR